MTRRSPESSIPQKSGARRSKTQSVTPKKARPQLTRLIGPAIILVAAAIAVWPLLRMGPSCGADFYFHFGSWIEAQRSMLQGIPYPHWASSTNYGAGEPRFVFYPPLTWMCGAILGLFFSWASVPLVFIYLLLAATGLAHRALAREVLADGPATLAGCVAIFLGNTLIDVYMRSDYAELTGGFWIPLLLLFALRNRRPAGTPLARTLDSAAPLALVVAGIWLSNDPLGIMAGYLLAAVAVASALLQKSWTPLARAAVSFTLGVGLAGIYLLPAVWERNWTAFHNALARGEYRIENGWLFASHAGPEWSGYNDMLAIHSLSASIVLAVTLIALLIAWKRGTLPAARSWWIPLALLSPAVLCFQLPVSLFAWNLLPGLRLLQFPWRWLLLMQPPLAVFFASAVWVQARRIRIPLLAGCALLFILAMGATLGIGRSNCGTPLAEVVARVERGQLGGKPEYAPPNILNTLVEPDTARNCVVASAADLAGSQPVCSEAFMEPINRPEHKAFTGTADRPGYLILNLRSFPAWAVTVNNQPVKTTPERGHGLIAVPVPQGTSVVTAEWTTTPDVWAGRLLTALALVLLAALVLLQRRQSRQVIIG